MNKKISTPIGIIIILICALLAGVLIYQYWWIAEEEVKAPVEDETADWQTYKIENFGGSFIGYKIKYPPNFIVSAWEDRPVERIPAATFHVATIIRNDRPRWYYEVTTHPCFDCADDEANEARAKDIDYQATNKTISQIMVSGVKSMKVVAHYTDPASSVKDRISVIVPNSKKNLAYVIQYTLEREGVEDDKAIEYFNQLLSTFRFLE